MATQIVQGRRIVSYLPSLRYLIIRCQAFSTVNNTEVSAQETLDDTTDKRTVWPDALLGPLGPKDKRFPLPGLVGPCVNTRQLRQEQISQPLPPSTNQVDLDAILPPQLSERHIDISEQFLTSIDELDPECLESARETPSNMDKMEYNAHECPDLLRRDFKELFPERDITEGDLTVITISLKTKNDMTAWSSEVEEERETLLESFVQGAVQICQSFETAGFWADFIDPSSGKPFKGPHTNSTLFETDERYRKLGFDINDLGCCKVISHPVWGSHAYIGSMFTDAPLHHPLINNLTPSI